MREFAIDVPVDLSAEELWAQRLDVGWDRYFAYLDHQTLELLHQREKHDDTGLTSVDRSVKLAYLENPVPVAMRKMLGRDEVCFVSRIAAPLHAPTPRTFTASSPAGAPCLHPCTTAGSLSLRGHLLPCLAEDPLVVLQRGV